ncbi:MAG: pyridoxamine 5'-phosphate oxidase [Francisellaceae bacterium]|jgi:pyridoxamine 5'-phosphate oxidase
MTNLSKWRVNYPDSSLIMDNMPECPFILFQQWLDKAISDGVLEPNAMTLSTINDRCPESRMVLLKDFNEDGFIFFTNYNSAKGKQILKNKNVSLCFWWPNSHRQVRINGEISKISSAKSDAYFNTRDRDTQIGAWASNQSIQIENYKTLIDQNNVKLDKFAGKVVTRPQHWGGYIIKPVKLEFWQGRHSRLHDRVLFVLNNEKWSTSRLSP